MGNRRNSRENLTSVRQKGALRCYDEHNLLYYSIDQWGNCPRENGRLVKEQLYGQFARSGKAVDSPQRLELLDLLCQGERPVEEPAREVKLTLGNASRHLQILRGARLVEARKQGVKVYYRMADEAVYRFFRGMRRLAEERLAEVQRIKEEYFGDRRTLQPVDREDLMNRAGRGDITLLDVRPAVEYRAGHLPCARSIPLKELKAHLDDLPRDQEIVAYCRGPCCVLAREAVRYLSAKGFKAHRLEDGVLEWRDAGLPVVEEKESGRTRGRSPLSRPRAGARWISSRSLLRHYKEKRR